MGVVAARRDVLAMLFNPLMDLQQSFVETFVWWYLAEYSELDNTWIGKSYLLSMLEKPVNSDAE